MESAAQKLNYDAVDDRDIFLLIKRSRAGMKYATFQKVSKNIPLKLAEWSKVLHLSERTLQRYKKEKLSFAPLYSEKIIEIQLLFNKGKDVFGSEENLYKWLSTKNIALGGISPISLLDNTFGILMIKDEIARIEHGILA